MKLAQGNYTFISVGSEGVTKSAKILGRTDVRPDINKEKQRVFTRKLQKKKKKKQ